MATDPSVLETTTPDLCARVDGKWQPTLLFWPAPTSRKARAYPNKESEDGSFLIRCSKNDSSYEQPSLHEALFPTNEEEALFPTNNAPHIVTFANHISNTSSGSIVSY